MEIFLNNKNETFDKDALTVTQLLEIKRFTFKMIIVKINGKLIKKENYKTAVINDGDNVNVIHLISGG
jgi:thiamine biosynthesis protein ThiS